jgi:nicotinamide-nucleotide adenylyltransferase
LLAPFPYDRGILGLVRFRNIAMIARWKPVHLGHSAVLDALLAHGDHVTIGIGSSNRYNAKNPFSAEETRQMLELALGSRPGATIVEVPDLDDGPRWRLMVTAMLGPLDAYVTANGYVRSLLLHDYEVIHPVHLVPPERRVRVDGTMVRLAMARGGDEWRALVPAEIAGFLESGGLVERFRREFGEETLRLADVAGSTS